MAALYSQTTCGVCRAKLGDLVYPASGGLTCSAQCQTIADLRAKLAAAEAAGPAVSVGEDPAYYCSLCLCDPHTWRECAETLHGQRSVMVGAAHKAIADIQRMLGADEEAANANYTDAIDLAREVRGRVDGLEVAVRALTEQRDEATARAEQAEAKLADVSAHFDDLAGTVERVHNANVECSPCDACSEQAAADRRKRGERG